MDAAGELAQLVQSTVRLGDQVVELRRQLGGLAVTLAGKVVGESLEDDARQRRTVERFLDGLDSAPSAAAATPATAR